MSKKNRDRRAAHREFDQVLQQVVVRGTNASPTPRAEVGADQVVAEGAPFPTAPVEVSLSDAVPTAALSQGRPTSDTSQGWSCKALAGFLLAVTVFLAGMGWVSWWLLGRSTPEEPQAMFAVEMNDPSLFESLEIDFWARERALRVEARARLPAAVQELCTALINLTDRQFVNRSATTTAEQAITQLLRDYARSRYALSGWETDKTFGPEQRAFQALVAQVKAGSLLPLVDQEVGRQTVPYRGIQYRLDDAGVAELNEALNRDGTGCRLAVWPDGTRTGLLFGRGRYDATAQVWWCQHEFVRSPLMLSGTMGITDTESFDIIIRESAVRETVHQLMSQSWLSNEVWQKQVTANRELIDVPVAPELRARTTQLVSALRALRSRALAYYGVQGGRLFSVFDHPAWQAVYADAIEFTLCHEIGHRDTVRVASNLFTWFTQEEGGGVQLLGETVVTFAPHGPLQTLAREARDPKRRASAERKFFLFLALSELRRFSSLGQSVAQGNVTGREYLAMSEHMSLVMLTSLAPDGTINWRELSERSQRIYRLLVVQLSTDAPDDLFDRMGAHGTVPKSDRLIDLFDFVNAEFDQPHERLTFLEWTIALRLANQRLIPWVVFSLGRATLVNNLSRRLEVDIANQLLTVCGRPTYPSHTPSFMEGHGDRPVRPTKAIYISLRPYLDRLRNEQFAAP